MNEVMIVLTMALAIITIAALVIRAVRRQKKAATEQLNRLGFFELPGPDPDLLAEIRSLVPNQRRQIAVGTIYKRSGGYSDMYAFYPDMSTSTSTTIAVRAPHLNLPLFRLFARVDMGGMLGGLANDLILRTIGKGLRRSEWRSDPKIGERYFLFAENPEEAERFMVDCWGRLLRENTDRISVFGRGSLLAFSRSVTPQEARHDRSNGMVTDPFATFVQRVDMFARSIRSNGWERADRTDHTVA